MRRVCFLIPSVASGRAIADDALLMMFDVPRTHVEEATAIVMRHHLEAERESTEPAVPEFPSSAVPPLTRGAEGCASL